MTDATRIRRATQGDVAHILAVKRLLAMPRQGAETTTGGFILGSSRASYARFICEGYVHLLETARHGVVGFAIALGDQLMRSSEIWERRRNVEWSDDVSDVEKGRVSYYEQLAILPERHYRLYAPSLALAPYRDLVESGHTHLFATVVREPIHNRAAIPLLKGIGARAIGRIDERYEGVGRLVSDIYMARIDRARTDDPVESTSLGAKVRAIFARLAE